ncbi:hypothetical protein [Shouchella lehensis]|uniref:Uncharacterized protein n=1 Tax=Shouchella lehensis G1 TaxID=1246626 RepID=A0A060LY44_9BACI|nr:hypothetical protein [Shouchella lehensis]AIC95082.1 hypothetical protein BleG1_2515 [Shouchella lehensis G1]
MEYLHVQSIEVGDDVTTVYLDQEVSDRSANDLKDGERILVDSDEFAFLYIIEDHTGFHGIRFDEHVWSDLKRGYERDTTFYLKLNESTRLTLAQFNDEMAFLLENIQGNGNYGEAFELAVKSVFE